MQPARAASLYAGASERSVEPGTVRGASLHAIPSRALSLCYPLHLPHHRLPPTPLLPRSQPTDAGVCPDSGSWGHDVPLDDRQRAVSYVALRMRTIIRRLALGAVRGAVMPLALGAAGQHESEARSGAPFRGLIRRMQGASQLIYSASLAIPDCLAAPALLHSHPLDRHAVRAFVP